MEPFYDRLIIRAATIDELFSEDFELSSSETGNAELAQRRLNAWRRAAASGDQALFARRLKRDGLDPAGVLAPDVLTPQIDGAHSAMDRGCRLDHGGARG